jgi:hypothetical protein
MHFATCKRKPGNVALHSADVDNGKGPSVMHIQADTSKDVLQAHVRTACVQQHGQGGAGR